MEPEDVFELLQSLCKTLMKEELFAMNEPRTWFPEIQSTPGEKKEKNEVAQWYPTLCNPMDCSPTKLLCPWDFPGKDTGVGCHFLLQRIFPIQGLNLGLYHCRQMLCHLSHQGMPLVKKL